MKHVTLLIDASDFVSVRLELSGFEHKFSPQNLSENLILEIKKFFKKQKLSFKDLDKIEIKTGTGFSHTRTAVATANALIFSLGLKQNLFKPIYNREPNITLRKN